MINKCEFKFSTYEDPPPTLHFGNDLLRLELIKLFVTISYMLRMQLYISKDEIINKNIN